MVVVHHLPRFLVAAGAHAQHRRAKNTVPGKTRADACASLRQVEPCRPLAPSSKKGEAMRPELAGGCFKSSLLGIEVFVGAAETRRQKVLGVSLPTDLRRTRRPASIRGSS